MKTYRENPAINITSLKAIDKSPLHYHEQERVDKPCWKFGRAAHIAVLEPDRFDDLYVVWGREPDQKVRRGHVYDDFMDDHPGKESLLIKEYDAAWKIHDALWRHVEARAILSITGPVEDPHYWTDPETGIKCKGRVDKLTSCVVDLKAMKDIEDREYFAACTRYMYHVTTAWYTRGVELATGRSLENPILIGVENVHPHDVRVDVMPAEAVEAGHAVWREWLDTLARCQESGEWPGQCAGVGEVEIQYWGRGMEDASEHDGADDIKY